MQCLKCGSISTNSNTFCVCCGSVYGVAIKGKISLYSQCHSCYGSIEKNSRFCPNCGTVCDYNKPIIYWDIKDKRVVAATEIVNVPSNTSVSIKRSRTIEHTIQISSRTTQSSKIEIGFEKIIRASIQQEIQRLHGYSIQQSETVEHEVNLSGDHSNSYKLVWTDIWRTGTIQIYNDHNNQNFQFQFRKESVFDVMPT